MDSGYYAAYAGLTARTQALDTAASNLSNANTSGFRAGKDYFRSAVVGPHALESQLNLTVNNYGVLGGNRLDLSQGALVSTGNPLDVSIEGQGFFQIQTASGLAYTRDGSFHRSKDGTLTTAAGEAVLDTKGKVIQVPPGEVSIGSNGVISVAGGAVGTIGVYTFDASTQLMAQGTNRYTAPDGVTPKLATDSTVRQGSLESSNQDIVQGSLDLVMMHRQAELMQKALTMFHSEFNKIASEDLPRV